MNWIPILVGAGAGALVVVSFHAVLRLLGVNTTVPKRWQQIAYAVVFALTWSLANHLVTPRVQQWHIASNLEANLVDGSPAFAAIQKYEPQVFARMVAEARAAYGQGAGVEETQAKMRAQLVPLIEQRLQVASDAAVHAYMKVNMQELSELLAGTDAACYTFLFSQSGPAPDITRRVKSETMKQDQAALAVLIESAATAPQKRIAMAEVEQDLEPILGAIRDKFGADIELLSIQQTGVSAKRRACEITLDMYSRVLALPPAQAGRLLRAMLSQ